MKRWLWIWFIIVRCMTMTAQENDALATPIRMPKFKGTVYEAFKQVTQLSGYMFIYDSNIVNNSTFKRISAGNYTLQQIVLLVTGDSDIQVKVIDKYALLFRLPEENSINQPVTSEIQSLGLTINGTVKDQETGEPLVYCSIGVIGTSIGTISNQNGQFLLKLPDSLSHAYVEFSYVGYEPQRMPVQLLAETPTTLYMNPSIIPLEAVVISFVNPQNLVHGMVISRSANYAQAPCYMTNFYREGIIRNHRFVSLTEAVFQVYKANFGTTMRDQIKLLKMRQVSANKADTFLLKLKAGLDATLLLDLVKNLPDFLTIGEESIYNYFRTGMSSVDGNLAHVVSFVQKPGIRGPFYKGELYIDADNLALLSARFEINPDYINQAQSMFVVRKAKNLDITPLKAYYTVSYRPLNGRYYINHIRGDLDFKVKIRKQFLGGSSTVHTFFEMVTCQIDTINVKRFSNREILPTANIFSETRFAYDQQFWGDFNIIMPEENLSEAISKISVKVQLITGEATTKP